MFLFNSYKNGLGLFRTAYYPSNLFFQSCIINNKMNPAFRFYINPFSYICISRLMLNPHVPNRTFPKEMITKTIIWESDWLNQLIISIWLDHIHLDLLHESFLLVLSTNPSLLPFLPPSFPGHPQMVLQILVSTAHHGFGQSGILDSGNSGKPKIGAWWEFCKAFLDLVQ